MSQAKTLPTLAAQRHANADPVRRQPALAGIGDAVLQARSAHPGAQPGHVRRLCRQHPDHAAVSSSRSAATARPTAASSWPSSVWLWFTVLFANFAEALAEGRSKAQAASLRGAEADRDGQEAGHARSTAPAGCRCPAPTCARGTPSWSRRAT